MARKTSVPASVRPKLGLEPGTGLERTEEQGKIVVRRSAQPTWDDIHSALFLERGLRKHTLAEMKADTGRHIRDRHPRD